MSQRSSDVGDDPAVPTPTARAPERPPSRAERRADAARMIVVLGQALGTQLARLAASADPAPDGWWFTPGELAG